VPAKLRQALAVGCRRIFVPAGNAPIIESSPALQHAVQGAGAEVCTVQRLDEACGRLFTQEGSGQPWDLLADTFREAWRIVRGGPGRRDGPSAQPDRHRLHVLLSTAFLAAILIMEGYKHYLAYAPEYPAAAAVLRTVASAAVVVALLLLGYGLILASLYHRKAWAWLASIALTGAGMAVAVLILGPMLPATTDISKLSDWPVWASLLKDVFVLWLFAWILLTNTFAVVVSLEHLADRHQYITARRCLSWDSALEGRMPIRAIAFPWSWAALGLFFVAVFLFVLEFLYYMNLREGLAAAYWEALLGLGRDMLLVAAAAEAMLFYKVAVASVRRLLA